MRVSMYPLYPEWGASSRLRVYTLARELTKLGHNVSFGLDPNADVTLVQKHRDGAVLDQLARARHSVYDWDDVECSGVLPRLKCHVITTDTRAHADSCPLPCQVVPDPIDFCPLTPLPASPGRGITWFGIAMNHRHWDGVDTIISNNDVGGGRYIPWSLQTFPDDLRNSTRIALLTHFDMDEGKSNNKMICAITLGVPCIVGHSPAYEALAHEMGLGWTTFRKVGEIPDLIWRLSQEGVREKYLAIAQPHVWEKYHPRVVAKRWLEVVA